MTSCGASASWTTARVRVLARGDLRPWRLRAGADQRRRRARPVLTLTLTAAPRSEPHHRAPPAAPQGRLPPARRERVGRGAETATAAHAARAAGLCQEVNTVLELEISSPRRERRLQRVLRLAKRPVPSIKTTPLVPPAVLVSCGVLQRRLTLRNFPGRDRWAEAARLANGRSARETLRGARAAAMMNVHDTSARSGANATVARVRRHQSRAAHA